MPNGKTRPAAADKKKSCHEGERGHPDHAVHLGRLSRVKGQIEGIQGMIEERRYCPDIINQLKAAQAGLVSIEAEIFKTHLRACVKDAIRSKDAWQAEAKIEEILKMVF